jgi:hypothetical protein
VCTFKGVNEGVNHGDYFPKIKNKNEMETPGTFSKKESIKTISRLHRSKPQKNQSKSH